MSLEGNGRPDSRLDPLSEICRLDTLERALRSHRGDHKERLRRIERLRARLEKRLKELEGG